MPGWARFSRRLFRDVAEPSARSRGVGDVDFFEVPPAAEPEPKPSRSPRVFPGGPWMGPPDNALGGVAPLRFILARRDEVAVTVTDVVAYGEGFTFRVTVRRREGAFPRRMFRFMHEPLDRGGALRPEFLRLGLAFADGRKATNLQSTMHEWLAARRGGPPTEPLLRQRGGQGSGTYYRFDYWAWPLPPEGALAFVCEWPSEGLPLTRHAMQAAEITRASKAVRLLWGEEEQFFGLRGSGGYVRMRAAGEAAPEPNPEEDS